MELRREQALVVRPARVGLAAATLAALALVAPATAAQAPTEPVYDDEGRLVQTPFAPTADAARLTERAATRLVLRYRKVADWLERYPEKDRVTEATYSGEYRDWTVKVWWE